MTTIPALLPQRAHTLALTLNRARGRPRARQAPIEPHHHTRLILHDLSRSYARANESLLVQLLWASFPSTSAKALAEKAAPVLCKTPRQIENILGGHCDGKAKDIERLINRLRILKQVEKLAQIIEGTSIQ